MVRHDSLQYRFSYPAIRYLPIPQKMIRLRFDTGVCRSILYTYFKQPSAFLSTHKCNQKYNHCNYIKCFSKAEVTFMFEYV